jgi:hypothetical protein
VFRAVATPGTWCDELEVEAYAEDYKKNVSTLTGDGGGGGVSLGEVVTNHLELSRKTRKTRGQLSTVRRLETGGVPLFFVSDFA